MITKKITSHQVEMYMDQASIQFILDAYYIKNKSQLSFETVVPLDIDGLNIHEEYLVQIHCEKGPVIALASSSDQEVIERLFRKFRRPLVIDLSETSGTINTNVSLSLNNIDFAVYDYKKGKKGVLIDQLKVNARMVGFIAVSNNLLSVAAMDGEVTTEGKPDTITSILMKVLASAFQNNFDKLPFPRMEEILDALPIVEKAYIKDGKVYSYISIDTTYAKPIFGGDAEDEKMPFFEGAAILYASAESGLVNELSEAFIKLPQYTNMGVKEVDGFGIRAQLFAGVKSPSIVIKDGKAIASAAAGAWAVIGVETCGQWSEIVLTAGNIQVQLEIKTTISENRKYAYISFVPNINSIKFTFPGVDLPVPFNILFNPISALLSTLVSGFGLIQKDQLAAIKLEIGNVTSPVQIFNVNLNATIEEFGFKGEKLVAKIKGVSNQ